MTFGETTMEDRAQAALGVLETDPDAVGRFDHVLVDEAQDLTTGALAVSSCGIQASRTSAEAPALSGRVLPRS